MSKLENFNPGDKLEQGKSWLESKTIWAIIVTALVTFVPMLFGFELKDFVNAVYPDLIETTNEIWTAVLGIVGLGFAFWGRVVAEYKANLKK